MAGLIAMISVFVVVTIEMTFSTMNGGAMGCHSAAPGVFDPLTPTPGHSRTNSTSIPMIREEGPDGDVRRIIPSRPRHRRSASIGTQLQKIERESMDMDLIQPMSGSSEVDEAESESDGEDQETRALTGGNGVVRNGGRARSASGGSMHRPMQRVGSRLTPEQQQQKNLLQVMLLEAGILFHSVFIGISPPRCDSLYTGNDTYNHHRHGTQRRHWL